MRSTGQFPFAPYCTTHYDAIGQLTSVEDTNPSAKDMKQQKHVYRYDDCGNMVYEYMRGNGTGEATVENTFTYDSLHRIVSAHEDYGNDNRSYSYNSLGSFTCCDFCPWLAAKWA